MTDHEQQEAAVYMKQLVDEAPPTNAPARVWIDWRTNKITDAQADVLWAMALEADRMFCGGKGEKMLTDQGYLHGRACVAVTFMRTIEAHVLGIALRCVPGGVA